MSNDFHLVERIENSTRSAPFPTGFTLQFVLENDRSFQARQVRTLSATELPCSSIGKGGSLKYRVSLKCFCERHSAVVRHLNPHLRLSLHPCLTSEGRIARHL